MNRLCNAASLLLGISLWGSPLVSFAWDVWIYDGKTGQIADNTSGCESVRAAYETSLRVLCPWETDPLHEDCLKLEHLEGSTRCLGDWEGFRIAYVAMPEQYHQAVLLEDPNSGWHFIFIQFGVWNKYSLGIQPEIWKVGNHSLLSNRLPISGSGGYHLELYWIKDGGTGEPHLLDLSAIEEAQKRLLPENGDTRCRSGNLDLRNLTYSINVWLPPFEGWPLPDGTIDMSLAIEGTCVTVAEAHWTSRKSNE